MRQRLGDMLLDEGLVSKEALEEALELQVVHGGRLGTNLVELGLLAEADLARVLGRLHNVAFASGSMIPDPRALALVEKNFADKFDLLPMRLDPTRMSVACLNPHDHAPLEQLAFKIGRRVIPVVVPEFRMHHLLRKHCGAFRTIRPIDVGQTRPSRTLAVMQQQEKSPALDLMGEDEFQALYAHAITGGVAAGKAQAGAAAPEEDAEETVEGVPLEEAKLGFAEAQAALARSEDREDIATTILRFAMGKWKRALILNVQGPLLSGWHGMGDGIRERSVRRIAVALRDAGTFKLVCDTRAHFVGPMKRDAGTAVFYRTLGGDGAYPKTAVLLPLLVRGRVVHLLYVDNGPGHFTPPDVGELMILAQSVARSYEALIRRRKSN